MDACSAGATSGSLDMGKVLTPVKMVPSALVSADGTSGATQRK